MNLKNDTALITGSGGGSVRSSLSSSLAEG